MSKFIRKHSTAEERSLTQASLTRQNNDPRTVLDAGRGKTAGPSGSERERSQGSGPQCSSPSPLNNHHTWAESSSTELHAGLCTADTGATSLSSSLPSHQPQDMVPKVHTVSCKVVEGPACLTRPVSARGLQTVCVPKDHRRRAEGWAGLSCETSGSEARL